MSDATGSQTPFADEADRFLRWALWCALTPMIAGVSVLVAYAITFEGFFQVAGLLVILGGLVLIMVGAVSLVRAAARMRSDAIESMRKKRMWWRWWTRLGLLLANFPLALACILAGTALEDMCSIDVFNRTGETIDECVINTDDFAYPSRLGPIPPNGNSKTRIFGDSIHATVTVRQKDRSATFDALSTSGGREQVYLTIKPGLVAEFDGPRD
jgi:hypothetical protein